VTRLATSSPHGTSSPGTAASCSCPSSAPTTTPACVAGAGRSTRRSPACTTGTPTPG
jgi:hypothetical protein